MEQGAGRNIRRYAMDRELTKVVNDHGNRISTLEKQVEDLTQELEQFRQVMIVICALMAR